MVEHTVKSFENEISQLRGLIAEMGGLAEVAIRDAIEKTSGLVGTTGTVTMSAKDHLGLDLGSFRMLEIRNGGWVLVK